MSTVIDVTLAGAVRVLDELQVCDEGWFRDRNVRYQWSHAFDRLEYQELRHRSRVPARRRSSINREHHRQASQEPRAIKVRELYLLELPW